MLLGWQIYLVKVAQPQPPIGIKIYVCVNEVKGEVFNNKTVAHDCNDFVHRYLLAYLACLDSTHILLLLKLALLKWLF